MTRRARWWRLAAATFAILNAAGAVYAAVNGEVMHATTHVALLLGLFLVWPIASRRRQVGNGASAPQLDTQIEQLQQSVDAIAVEVERIGEGQRFINKLQQEAPERQPLKKSDSSPE